MTLYGLSRSDRVARTIAGEPVDRPAVSLWRHFPGDDQRAADFAAALLHYQEDFGWDILNIVPAASALVIDYGGQDEWRGAAGGTREWHKRGVVKSLDWTMLRPLDPNRGSIGRLVEAITQVAERLRDETHLIVTLLNPLAQARELAGDETLMLHLRTQQDRLHSGLNTLTENLLRLVDTLKRLPVAGISLSTTHASPSSLSEDEYRHFALPYDRKIFEALPSRWWLTMLHFQSSVPYMRIVGELRPAVVSWRDQDSDLDLTQGKLLVGGAVCGGLHPENHVHLGTPAMIRDAVRDAVSRTNARRLIVSAGSSIAATTPRSNLRAAREAVERA